MTSNPTLHLRFVVYEWGEKRRDYDKTSLNLFCTGGFSLSLLFLFGYSFGKNEKCSFRDYLM